MRDDGVLVLGGMMIFFYGNGEKWKDLGYILEITEDNMIVW